MGSQRHNSTDILQDSDTLTGNGAGQVGGVEVVRSSRTAKSLELWVDITAIDAGVTSATFTMQGRIRGGSWYDIVSISTNGGSVSPPQALAAAAAKAGETPLGEEVRVYRSIVGGNVTCSVKVVRRE